ncbi:FtsX-like permease family protein [Desemzia sp. RIT804]|uniref:FtsX-like permease family protein n=1 Tax=Desemzia sp. RIT 804 TaxID=2810209 RepID=UPI001950FE6D|nr:FtsX-like permease family protein [Desemzia sp. RIT 804]
MKKKTLWKDIFREIAKSKMRFLSIFLIILLGVAFYSGIKATSPDMVDTADTHYKENNLMDVKVLSTYGLTNDDIELLKNVEGSFVEAVYTQDVILEGTDLVTKIVSTPNTDQPDINQPILVEGRLPENSGEIILDAKNAYTEEYSIGDIIMFKTNDDSINLDDSFTGLTYQVVGFANSPQFIENNARGNTSIGSGTLDGFAFIPQDDFNLDIYTEAYLTFSSLEDLQSYSDEYETAVKDKQTAVEEALSKRPEERREEIQQRIQDEIDKGQAELDDGRAEIEEGKQVLADAETQLANARAELDQGWQEYNNGVETFETEIANGQATIDQNTQELENSRIEIVNGKAALDTAQEELNNSKAALEQERISGETQIVNGTAALQSARETVTIPNETISAENQNALVNGAQAINPEISGVINGYLEGTVPVQSVLSAINEVEANVSSIDETEEAAISIQAWIEMARSVIQIPGMNVPLDQQVQVSEQLNTIEVELGELMTNYYDGVIPPTNTVEVLNTAETRLLSIRQQLDNYEAELNAGQEQIDQQRAELEAAEGQIAVGRAALEEAQNELNQQKENGEIELQQAEAELGQGEAEYQDAVEKFQSEKTEAEAEIVEAEAELAKGQRELDKAKAELDDVTLPEYYVLDRNTNPGYAEFKDNAERIASIAEIFPVFFFLIAALVSLTTMTRMVDEQRTQIGTLKALGYTNWDISKKFLVYATLASLTGAVIGLLLGFHLFPTVIINAYGSLYNLSSVQIGYYLEDVIVSLIIAFLCTGLTALVAVRVSLKSNAANLMRPKAPKVGKRILLERIPFIWNRFTFTQKITARNIFRYKRRMLMTVAGISGCTALLLTGFGLSDSISDVGTLQYGKINQYESIVALNTGATDYEKDEYTQLIENTSELESGLKVYQEIYNAEVDGVNPQDVTLFVPETTDNLDEFVSLTDRTSDEEYTLTNAGAVVSEKLADLFDLQAGDTLTLEDADNQEISVTVDHITENYLQHFVYLSPDYYESVVGEVPEANTHLLNFDESENWENGFGQQLTQLDAVVGVTFTSFISEAFKDTLESLVVVTIVLVVSAALLAFVVLYNLTNINVSERIRELSTIKVLGFYDKEVTMYVYRENFLLTLMGTAVGLLLGLLLHGFVLETAELDIMMFSPVVALSSYIYSALLTILFSTIVMIFMHVKLKNVDMLEALKTVE